MKKSLYLILAIAAGLGLLAACSMKKNTAVSRQYHALTAHYNTYFNGKSSYDESLTSMQKGYQENYTERIHMFPVSAQPKDKKDTGGQFDRAIEKANKAIKQHTIKQKPERKEGWKNDPKQVALQKKEEYNPFLKHCWMLIGQGQFYNADFMQASATFSYITRHYTADAEMVAQARIWQARCYAEINWLFEAESILDNLNKNGFPESGHKQFDRVYADCMIKSGRFDDAIPYLQKAIKAEKNKRQKSRMRYLLGQLYAETGQRQAAYEAFKIVAASNPPYELEFAARIRQTEVSPETDSQKILKMLNRMAKSDKNKNYLDQVYYAIGNIYMNRQDTTNAIENYSLGVEKSMQNGLDKAICNIRLGDIYFVRKDYVSAQPCFSDALSGIQKEYKDYDRVYRLSAVLDELVVYVEAVHLQDSLQTLSRMPEAERLAVIDKIIEDYIEKEKKVQEEAERERYLAEQSMNGPDFSRPGMSGNMAMPSTSGSVSNTFYFYDPQVVAQGKVQFQSRWGKRPLEDHWRRRNKQMIIQEISNAATDEQELLFDEEGNPIAPADSAQLAADSLATDPKAREYYLQQIPFSEDDLQASDIIIADGLFNIGMIYKDKLENKDLAVETFEELERRFPDNKYRMDYYYHTCLMAMRYHDEPLGERYKAKLIQTFPESDYAVAIADPNYEYNIKMMDRVQDSIYAATYAAYLEGDTATVRHNYDSFGRTYPLSGLNPQFMFLYALTYVQAGDAEGFKIALNALVGKYPQADVSALANEMLKGMLQGRALMQSNFTGMTWDMRFGLGDNGMLSPTDSARQFADEPDAPHRMILVYQKESIDGNLLLYAVAAFNFAHFTIQTFDLSIENYRTISILNISGFSSLDDALEYERLIYGPEGYAARVDRIVSFFPISENNFFTLMHGKTLDEYMRFFAEKYAEKAPGLVSRWRIRVSADEKVAEAEDKAVEKAVGLPDQTEETQPETTTSETNATLQTPPDNEQTETQTAAPKRPDEITLDQLLEQRKQVDKAELQRKEDDRKVKELQRKEAEKLKKQQADERTKLRKQKEKERKALQRQKEKERKERERENNRRLKEKRVQSKKSAAPKP